MNADRNGSTFQLTLSSIGGWAIALGAIWLLGLVGFGWLLRSLAILLALLLLTPIVGFVVLRWWLNRNLVRDLCPVCKHEFTGLNQTQFSCPSCGEPLQVEEGKFHRVTPPGTIDVEAIDVSSVRLEE